MESLPDFGVPKRITRRGAGFVVLAGIPLSFVAIGVFAAVATSMDLELDGAWWTYLVVPPLLAIGPAAAYYLWHWLEARQISTALGCCGLAVWTFGLWIFSAIGGWLGVLVWAGLTAAAIWNWRPSAAGAASARVELK